MLIWEAASRTYRDTATDALLSHEELTALRNAYALQRGQAVDELVDRFLDGITDVELWSLAFQELITHMMLTGYSFGRGGIDQMREQDYEQLAYAIEQQLKYAEQFTGDIVRGDVSPEQLRARAQMYTGSSVRMVEEGKAAAWDVTYPTFPGDTICKANCRCTWIAEDLGDRVEATWKLEPGSDHCETCLENSRQFNPYVIYR